MLAVLASPLGWRGVGDVAGLPVLLLTVGVVSLALRPLLNAFSRRMERRGRPVRDRSDREPRRRSPRAIERLGTQNLTEEHPSRLARWFFYTHPPVAERVAAARAQQLQSSPSHASRPSLIRK